MASAVAGGRKYQRLEKLFWGNTVGYDALAGLRLAFNPDATVPASKQAWIAEAKIRFAADEGFTEVIAAWEEECGITKKAVPSSETAARSTEDANTNDSSSSADSVSPADSVEASSTGTEEGVKGLHHQVRSTLLSILGKLRDWGATRGKQTAVGV
jgi:hypothetical protein